jgi:hypothetical protein
MLTNREIIMAEPVTGDIQSVGQPHPHQQNIRVVIEVDGNPYCVLWDEYEKLEGRKAVTLLLTGYSCRRVPCAVVV